ncbi:MAG: glycosyltransferase family 39 protein [Acidimicrobiales bacterium]
MRLEDRLVPTLGVPGGRSGWDVALRVAVVLALAVAVWLRFQTASALWLDEALTVDIAREPLPQIAALLRHDGAPPLYYYLLHFWMALFGQGNLAVRSLAGVIGVVNLPLAWLTGYRIGSRSWISQSTSPDEQAARDDRGRTTAWAVTLLLAMSPFAVYYDTEARMYALAILLGTLTVLCLTSLLARPSPSRALGLTVVASASLYTHYWALYSCAVLGLGLLYCAWRGPYKEACRYGVAALLLAAVSFLPWVPTLLFQARHTGTPWAEPAQLSAVIFTITQFAGGDSDFGRGLAVLFFFLAVLALFGTSIGRWLVMLDLRTRPGVRALGVGVVATLVLGILGGRIDGSTFADRYTSFLLFPSLVALGYGLTTISDRRTRQGLLAVALFLGFLAALPNVYISRTGAGQVGAAIAARAHRGDVVAYCPDQLGPAVSRVLQGRFDEITFPRDARPEIVDWVDYLKVVGAASPRKFVKRVESLAGQTGSVFYVWAPGYNGYGSKCQTILHDLVAWPGHRYKVVLETLKSDTPFEIYEGSTLDSFTPR